MGCARRETGRGYPDAGSCDYDGIALSCGRVAISCRWHSDIGKYHACARAHLAHGIECEFRPGLTNAGAEALSDRWGFAARPAFAKCCGMDVRCGFLDDTPQHSALVGDSAPMMKLKYAKC